MQKIPILPLGMTLSIFFPITFTLCIVFGLLLPEGTALKAWHDMFPFLTWMSWPSFLYRLALAYVLGWYIAVIFAPLHNFFAARAK